MPFICINAKNVVSLRTIFNTNIMKKVLFFVTALFLLTLNSCGYHRLTVEEAKATVVQGENENLPLTIQRFHEVESIVIDSIHITVADAPMSGYLYTTWKYVIKKTIHPTPRDWSKGIYEAQEVVENKEKQVIVAVRNIRQSKKHRGYIEWETWWEDAYLVVQEDIWDSKY